MRSVRPRSIVDPRTSRFLTVQVALAALAIVGAGCTDTSGPTASVTEVTRHLPKYYDQLPQSGEHLDLAAEILGNGVTCTYTSSLVEDTMYFEYPSGPYPNMDTVTTTSPKGYQGNQDCELKDPGWVWVVITGGNTTEYRPRVDINLVTENYMDLPSPGSISLTAEENSQSGCEVVGWRIPGNPVMHTANVSYSTSSAPDQLLAVFDCGGQGGPLGPTG